MNSLVFSRATKTAVCLLLTAGLLIMSGCGNTAASNTVPGVTGMQRDAAQAAIAKAGLTLGTVTEEFSATVPAGQVIRQNPEAAAQLAPGTAVDLVISKGAAVTVPNVVGQTQATAATTLSNMRLMAGAVSRAFSDTVPSGRVISQNPEAGAQASPLTVVHLVVSNGPQPISVPNVVGMTQAAASAALAGSGLTAGNLTEAFSPTVPAGNVISQDPKAATQVSPGRAVDMVTSKGPQPVSVPGVVGMAQAAASAALTGAGLTVGTVTQAFSATVSAGQVINQNPAAATLVNLGTAVALVISKGPQPVNVPNVVGQAQAAATTLLTDAGLTVGSITEVFSITVPAGQVMSQNPAAAAQVSLGTAVNLTVSKGHPTNVPNVVGLTQAAATTALTGAELTVGTVTQQFSATIPASNVISQDPVAATQVSLGTAVSLAVSKGPQPPTVPNVVGLTQSAASTLLTKAALTTGTITQEFSETVPAGYVMSQDPAAAAPINPGTTVALVVSKGPVGGVLVNVPDASLAADIREQLGLAGGTPLTTAHLAMLLDLYANYSGITDLTGLEYAVNLLGLSLDYNQFTDLSPLAGLTNLTGLTLQGNKLTDLTPLEGLTNLTGLALTYNQLTDVSPLAGMTNLVQLIIGGNLLTDVSPLTGLTNLTELWLDYNRLTVLSPLPGMTKLKWLNLEYNQLTDISTLAELTSLQSLTLSINQLTDISPLAGLTNLTGLSLSDNQLTDLRPLAGLTSLTGLGLNFNQLTDVSPLAGLTNLTSLSLARNQLTDVSPLARLPKMLALDLHGNGITTVGSFVSGTIFTGPPPTDGRLDLRENPLSSDTLAVEIPALQTRGVDVYYGPWEKSG